MTIEEALNQPELDVHVNPDGTCITVAKSKYFVTIPRTQYEALRGLAAENERLKEIVRSTAKYFNEEKAALEAERDQWKATAETGSMLRDKALPAEIAGLIKRAADAAINTAGAEDRKLFAELGEALRTLALSNAVQ